MHLKRSPLYMKDLMMHSCMCVTVAKAEHVIAMAHVVVGRGSSVDWLYTKSVHCVCCIYVLEIGERFPICKDKGIFILANWVLDPLPGS